MAPSNLREWAHTERASVTSTSQQRRYFVSFALPPGSSWRGWKIESQNSNYPGEKQMYDMHTQNKHACCIGNGKTDFLHTNEKGTIVVHTHNNKKKILHQIPFQEKLHNHLLLQGHFPSRATSQRQACPLIQVWCRGREGKGEEGQ